MVTLAERLGHAPDDRLVIINCDDLGSSHAANVGIYEAVREGLATSASLMVPCPWAREAAARYRPQVEEYRRAAAELHGLEPEAVRGGLLFLPAGRLVALPRRPR
jgi:hypothetical protein